MPRKSIPRAFKLVCKHYKGFDRHFATKAVATRKLPTSQGVYVNHKLAATSDAKNGKNTGKPLVRSYSSSYPSFASQPVAAHTRSATRLASLQPASSSAAAQAQLSAPSFAARPVWERQAGLEAQAVQSSGADTVMSEAIPSTRAASEQLGSEPMYQYAQLGQQSSPARDLTRRGSTGRRGQERSALKWYGSLDRRPINKVSGSPSSPLSLKGDKSRMASAFAAYADLGGRRA